MDRIFKTTKLRPVMVQEVVSSTPVSFAVDEVGDDCIVGKFIAPEVGEIENFNIFIEAGGITNEVVVDITGLTETRAIKYVVKKGMSSDVIKNVVVEKGSRITLFLLPYMQPNSKIMEHQQGVWASFMYSIKPEGTTILPDMTERVQ